MFSPAKTELRFRVSTNIAAYLEPLGTARLELQKRVAKLYDARSQAAHGGSRHSEVPLRSPLPFPYPKVPACEECNNKKSKNDSYLRDMLVCDLYCSEHPVAKELMKGKVIRSVQKNHSEIARAAVKSVRLSPLYTRGGLYLGDYPSIPIEGERVNEMIRTMIRGLYFNLVGKRLPDNYVFDIRRQDQLYVKEVFEGMKKAGANFNTLGTVFGCQFMFAAEDNGITCWYLWFYDGFFLRVDTAPAEIEEPAKVG